ncbi:MAG: chitobiase/beta-hexosaminidase C-terminal domain-containing protein [Oscillospiraceae bacterium]|nr:chitobiase/beta-hexosaminidase C-terminal domain-containing protein [Oscillospiraceae bacterium]
MKIIKYLCALILIASISVLVLSCTASEHPEQSSLPAQENNIPASSDPSQVATAENAQSPSSANDLDWLIRITDAAGAEFWSFNESMLEQTMHDSLFTHVYSTINRWPTPRIFAAEGYVIADILDSVGLLDTAQTITFRAVDGYEISLTRQQLLSPQYFYPQVAENAIGAAPVFPIIAFRLADDASHLDALISTNPTLIIGQSNPFEQTNHAFVIGVHEIVVDSAPSDTWAAPGTFPIQGEIPIGDTVRLQHPNLGLVHIFYTIDGSDPTPFSTLFNPSAFRPELTESIHITEPVIISTFARGFGKNDSDIAIFEFTPIP